MKTVIFDLDGTLADLTHRLHYVKNGNRNWDKFFEECDKDLPIPEAWRGFTKGQK
jgi:phosphoglycolate phosphatase-like HAD superfamily hydrolase